MTSGVIMAHAFPLGRSPWRAAGTVAVVAGLGALAGCSSGENVADVPPVSFEVREVAARVADSQWSDEAADADAAAAVLSQAGLDELLTADEYLAMVEAGCPANPLPSDQAGWVCDSAQSEAFLVFPATLTEADVDSAEAAQRVTSGEDSGGTPQPREVWEVQVSFTTSGTAALEDLTADLSSRAPQGTIAFVVDGKVVSAPMVVSPISGGSAQLVAPWTKQEAEHLVASLAG